MVLRLLTLATIAFVGLGLASLPAAAEEPQDASSKTTIEKAEKTVVPLPAKTRRARLSTRDRWRGAPYLRSSADETLRSQALDIALPSANPAFQGGVTLQQPVFAYEDGVRHEALNMALPPANPAWVGGGQPIAGAGF
jgi:hypothetical protein